MPAVAEPTTTTTAPPSNAPPPAPPTAPDKAPADYLGDIVSELGDLDEGKPLPGRDDKGKFKPIEKPAAKPTEKPAEKPAEQPQAKSETGEKPTDQPAEPPKPVKAAELRTAYEGLKKKVKEELEPEVQRLRSKVAEYETKPPEDTAPILQKLKTLEERNTQLERHIALVDYEQSQEFKTKYEQPWNDMWQRATSAFNQLVVREQDGVDDVGEPKFKRRAATEADLIDLGALPLSQLDEKAQAMFGASAPRAIQYIERLRELAGAKQTAIEEAKNKAGEWKSTQELQSKQTRQNREEAWLNINQSLQEKFPDAYVPEEGNAEDKASHTKGFALANLLWDVRLLTPEQIDSLPSDFKDMVKANKPLSEIQKTKLNAIARLKTANHDRLIAARKKDKARIAELEKALAEYEKSEPSADKAGEGGKVTDKPWDQVIEDELKAMDK